MRMDIPRYWASGQDFPRLAYTKRGGFIQFRRSVDYRVRSGSPQGKEENDSEKANGGSFGAIPRITRAHVEALNGKRNRLDAHAIL